MGSRGTDIPKKAKKGKKNKLKSQTPTLTQFTVSHRGKQQSAKRKYSFRSVVHLKTDKNTLFHRFKTERVRASNDALCSACFSRNRPTSVAHFVAGTTLKQNTGLHTLRRPIKTATASPANTARPPRARLTEVETSLLRCSTSDTLLTSVFH